MIDTLHSPYGFKWFLLIFNYPIASAWGSNRKERFLRVRLNIFSLFLERVVHFQQFLVVLKGHEKIEWHRKNKLQMIFLVKLKKKSFCVLGEYATLQKEDGKLFQLISKKNLNSAKSFFTKISWNRVKKYLTLLSL